MLEDVGRCSNMLEDVGGVGRCWQMLGDVGRCWEMLEDVGKCWVDGIMISHDIIIMQMLYWCHLVV